MPDRSSAIDKAMVRDPLFDSRPGLVADISRAPWARLVPAHCGVRGDGRSRRSCEARPAPRPRVAGAATIHERRRRRAELVAPRSVRGFIFAATETPSRA